MNTSKLYVMLTLLFVCGTVAFSTPPDWTVNPANFQFNANVTSVVTINDGIGISSTDVLAAFAGNEVRGITSPVMVGEQYFFFLTTYSNLAEGEILSFQYYSVSSDTTGYIIEVLPFVANGVTGSPVAPLVLHGFLHNFDRTPEVSNIPDQTIEQGNSFLTFDLDSFLTEYNNDEIQWSVSGNVQLNVSIGTGNIVSITQAENFIGTELLVFKATDNTAHAYFDTDTAKFTVRALDVPPQISVIPNQTIRIGGAFDAIDLNEYLTSSDGDAVEWKYIFHPSGPSEEKPRWEINPNDFQNSMSVTAEVASLGLPTSGNGNLLAAFSGDEIRGVASPIYAVGKWLYFLSLYANEEEEEITFWFYDSLRQKTYPVLEKIFFQNNNVIGEPQNPFEMSAGNIVPAIDNDGYTEFNVPYKFWVGSEMISFVATDKNSMHHYADTADVLFTSEYFAFSANPVLSDFGSVAQGSSKDGFITITNFSPVNLGIISVTSSNEEFTVSPAGEIVIAKGKSKVFAVTFAPVGSNRRSAEIIFVHDAESSPDTVYVSGFGLGKFRTFSHNISDFTQDAVKLKYKKGTLVEHPNLMTAVEETFRKQVSKTLFPKGRTFLGIDRTDSAKAYAWMSLKKAKELAKGMTGDHNGQAYPFDYLRDPIKNTKKKLAKSLKFETKLNNPAIAQGLLFKLNLLASDSGVTPYGLGSLVLDTTIQLAGRQLKGMTLNEVANYYDSIMTYWKKYSVDTTEDFEQLRLFVMNVLKRINDGFYQAIDTSVSGKNYVIDSIAIVKGNASSDGKKNAYAMTLIKGKSVSEISILKQNATAKQVQLISSDKKIFPNEFSLFQNYPNPFNPTTAIGFSLLAVGNVTLKIYNVLGQEVATLLNNELLEEGMHEVQFDASTLSSGMYFYRLTAQSEEKHFVSVKKLLLLK